MAIGDSLGIPDWQPYSNQEIPRKLRDFLMTDIFSFIVTAESEYESQQIRLADNWSWSMRNHIQILFHLVNNKFYTGQNDWLRAFKNIIKPVINLSIWTEDIEVKDIVFYIEERLGRIKSFFIKKYHDEVYVKEHNLDKVLDDITESDLTYGGALVQKNGKDIEVLKLESIAFCDQTDILGGPIGFKKSFSPDKLRQEAKERGWGEEKNGATTTIEELIVAADTSKTQSSRYGKKNETPGKNIDVYIVKGSLPENFLKDDGDSDNWFNQLHVVAIYQTGKDKQSATLYRKKWDSETMKFFTSKEVYGRALGSGIGEDLLHPQVWTNFVEIHKMDMIKGGAKNVLWTDDPNYANRNKIEDLDNNEITTLAEGRNLGQVPMINPAAMQFFMQTLNEQYEQAQLLGSAFDPLMGKEATAGTTFRGQERTVFQGRGIHERRRGQRAKFIEEIYRDWIIPDIVTEIMNGKEFLATLSSEEMQWVSETAVKNMVNREIVEQVLNGKIPEDMTVLAQQKKELFMKEGNKRMLEIIKGEFKDAKIRIGINVSSKQKDLANMTQNILSIFQMIFSNPQGFAQAMQNPALASTFDDILEYSGISPASFAGLANAPMPMNPQIQQPTQSPQLQLNALNPQPA